MSPADGAKQSPGRSTRRARKTLLGDPGQPGMASSDARGCAGVPRASAQTRAHQQRRHQRHAGRAETRRHLKQFDPCLSPQTTGAIRVHREDPAGRHRQRREALQPVPLHRRADFRHQEGGRNCGPGDERLAALPLHDGGPGSASIGGAKNCIEGSTIESERFDSRSGGAVLRFDYRTRGRFSGSIIEADKKALDRPGTRMNTGFPADFSGRPEKNAPLRLSNTIAYCQSKRCTTAFPASKEGAQA